MITSAVFWILFAPTLCVVSCFPGLPHETNTGATAKEAGPGDKLIEWARDNGAEVHVYIGTVPHLGIEGTIADKDFSTGEQIISIPLNMTVELAPAEHASPLQVFRLLEHRASSPEWYSSFKPYFDSIPPPNEMSRMDFGNEAALPLLQDPVLADAITEAIADEREWHSVLLAPGYNRDVLEGISVDDFRYLAVYLATYLFSFDSHEGVPTRYALPILDKLNHANEQAANAMVQKSEDTFNAVAIRPIAKGEEVTHMYYQGNHRNDLSLFHYGFIQDVDPPLLACIDRPGGGLYGGLYGKVCPGSDWDYEPGGPLATSEEADRLARILLSFPTSEGEDAAFLSEEGSKLTNTQRLFVRFRMLRKKALRLMVDRLQRQPSADHAIAGTTTEPIQSSSNNGGDVFSGEESMCLYDQH